VRAGRQVEAVGQATKEILVRVGMHTTRECLATAKGQVKVEGQAVMDSRVMAGHPATTRSDITAVTGYQGRVRTPRDLAVQRNPRVIQRAIGSLDLSVDTHYWRSITIASMPL
jgi:hypothetical protein